MLTGTDAIAHRATLAILVGGNSSRFGTDKGLYRPNSQAPIVIQQALKLRPWFKELLIIGGSDAQIQLYRAAFDQYGSEIDTPRFVMDHPNRPKAALCGIETAISHAKFPWVMAIGVDQIALTYDHLRNLLQNLALMNSLSKKQPLAYLDPYPEHPLALPSLWPSEAGSKVSESIDNSNFSVQTILTELKAICFEPGRHIRALRLNANTEAEALQYFASVPESISSYPN